MRHAEFLNEPLCPATSIGWRPPSPSGVNPSTSGRKTIAPETQNRRTTSDFCAILSIFSGTEGVPETRGVALTIWTILLVVGVFNVIFVLASTRYRTVRNRERGSVGAGTRFS